MADQWGRTRPRAPRLSALLLLLSGTMLIDALEVSTVVVALPAIGADLRLSPAATSVFVIGFALGFGGFILLGARLMARFGRRRVYLGALLAFAAASVLSGLAVDGLTLAAARVVKGVCVALTAPAGLAIIAGTFAEGAPRNRALSTYALFGASGFSTGLLLSGLLTGLSWRWTLVFSGPVALVLFLVGLRLVPADRVAAAATVPASVLRSGRLLRSAAGAAAMNGTYWSFLLIATFRLQRELGWSPLATGLALLPTSLPLALSASLGGRLVGRYGPARLIAFGALCTFLGYACYLGTAGYRDYLPAMLPTVLLVGAGFLASFAALHVQAIAGVAPGHQGLVGGVYQTSVQLGGALLLALTAMLGGPGRYAAVLLITVVAAGALLTAVAGLRTWPAPTQKGESCPAVRSESR